MPVRSFVVAVLAALVLLAAVPAAGAAETGYVPPVSGPIVDGFRPPSSQYGPGNRGIDLAAEPGELVRAAADGTVTFAGRIGSSTHVVVLHPDGLRTSYSFLAGTELRRGAHVEQGDVVGRAAGPVHFGVRAGDEYLDPTAVLAGGPPSVHLVPAGRQPTLTEAQERHGIVEGLLGLGGSVVDAGAAAVGWAASTTTTLAGLVAAYGWQTVEIALLDVEAGLRRLENGVRAFAHMLNVPGWHAAMHVRWLRVLRDQVDCTPAGTSAPPRPGSGHVVVLVAGLNSTGGGGSVTDVDTDALGYAPDHVAQFSYRGGQAPGHHLSGIPEHDYSAMDTWGDLDGAGQRLRQLLAAINRTHPGVPVDLIAHSQGGLVVRAALNGSDAWAPDLPTIPNVITIATPHHGSPLGSGSALTSLAPGGEVLQGVITLGSLGQAPASATSVQQMSSGSTFILDLNRRSMPAGTRLTSIAARGDEVVGAGRSAVEGATNVIVPVDGLGAHGAVPGDPRTLREITLALGGRGPTCRPGTPSRDLRLAWVVGAASTSPGLVAQIADQIAGLSPRPWSPVEFRTAPSGTRPPG